MKFKSASSTLTAAIVGSAACFQFPAPTQAWVAPALQLQRPGSNAVRSLHFSSSSLKSAVAEEKEAVSPLSTPQGETIAEGSIVTVFPGGMSAVKINDDWTDALPRASPEPTSPEQAAKASLSAAKASLQQNLAGDLQGRNVVFPNGSVGVVVAHRPPVVYVYSDKDPLNDTDGGHVKVLETMALISTSSGSSVVDCFGRSDEPLSTKSETEDTLERAIFASIPQVKDIALINNPMLTGITMVDALAPIGRGQNMLMIGHDLDEMRGFTVDFLKTQVLLGNNTKCVYAAVDNKDDVLQRLRAAGIQDAVHVVAPSKDGREKAAVSKAAEAVAIAGSACAIGEAYALQKGVNSIVVVDTIDQHKNLWDATTRVLVDVFGIDAVVKADREGGASSEMRAFYSSLIQRSGQYKVNRGGGSVTLLLLTTIPRENADADTVFSESDFELSGDRILDRIKVLSKKNIPLTAATLRKLNIPIPSASEGKRRLVLQHMDDLISMSDGQIWLDERLEAAGQRPPMDPQRSVTRIGIGADTPSRADAPALRQMVEGLRLLLSQGANMEGAQLDKASKKQIGTQKALLLAMHQNGGLGGRLLSESCTVMLAALQGNLGETIELGHVAGTEEGQRVIDGLLEYVRTNAPGAVAEIDKTLDLNADVRDELIKAIGSYFESLSS
jgi:F-type H+-transporting ATPase subunit alpha